MHTSGLRVHGRAFAHIAAFHPEITALRRDPHAHPELGFDEVYTAARVQEALKVCGVDEIHSGIGKTGVVAVIKGQHNESGKMLGLRADMDALPMTEHNDFAWKSATVGLMHGCGHDGHTAMLVGAARYLAETRNFDGTTVLIFQPGEEGYAGAKAMIEDGLFARFPVQAVYGMHNWPVDYGRVYPATINTAAKARFAADVAQSLVGREHVVRDLEPSMGAEDFSFMLQVEPGAYMRIDQGEENGVGSCFLHNSRYDFDDDILPFGPALHASLVERAMPIQSPSTV